MDVLDNLLTKKITIGVTGLSRSGKTIFIGALAQALTCADFWGPKRGQGPLAQFGPIERGQFRSARIRDDVNTHLPQFPFRNVRDILATKNSAWPKPTEGISHLTLDLEYYSESWFKRVRTVRIELVDYPGEWLVDLPMLDLSYADWSEKALGRAKSKVRKPWSEAYFKSVSELNSDQIFDEEIAIALTEIWATYLQQAADFGLPGNQPGRLLRPDALRHSPVLRLVPLPPELLESGLGEGMKKRFQEYNKKVITPFFDDHFSQIDRQIVLVDILRVLQQGKPVFDELVETMREMMPVFNYGKRNIFSWIFGTKITRLLFAATKADHVTRGDRVNLEQMVKQLIALVDDKNEFRSKSESWGALALASVRATEDRMTIEPPKREILYGHPAEQDQAGQWDPGGLPLDMPPDWDELFFEFLQFEPPAMPEATSQGYPAINLGKALDFLIGEDLT